MPDDPSGGAAHGDASGEAAVPDDDASSGAAAGDCRPREEAEGHRQGDGP